MRRNDLEADNAPQTDEYYLKQAREQIAAYERSDEYQQALREDLPKDFIDDSPQDMTEIPQNKPVSERTVGEELAASPTWLKINLPNDAVGNQYGNNTLIRMPEGEYTHYAVFVPSKFVQKSADGKSVSAG